jgi:6-phosphofructokinase 1
MYTSDFMCRIFEQESEGLFDAREVVLGHIQQGGNPTPFDRILATRLASHSIDYLSQQIEAGKSHCGVIGLYEGKVRTISLRQSEELAQWEYRRPTEQWWLELRGIIDVLAARLAVVPGGAQESLGPVDVVH